MSPASEAVKHIILATQLYEGRGEYVDAIEGMWSDEVDRLERRISELEATLAAKNKKTATDLDAVTAHIRGDKT